jgi:hypothetical protein
MIASSQSVIFRVQDRMPFLLEDIKRNPDGSICDGWVVNGGYQFDEVANKGWQFSREVKVPMEMIGPDYEAIIIWAETRENSKETSEHRTRSKQRVRP